ncbi:hypothetical protein ACJRPK_14030 [Aquimarina sp. 2-A2]|uniref:hypothetical protein n=1 Tax=Aquimarina sp. 2-A2 TaxID=3382644 RepID=UPI00387F266C
MTPTQATRKANQAISYLRLAESELEVLDAIALKEKIEWNLVNNELADQWNEAFGDAQKYLP